jgi:hypothetical protein
MDYSMIGKIEKAKRYAQERERFEFHSLRHVKAIIILMTYYRTENGLVIVSFLLPGRCVHTMSLENILEGMTNQSKCRSSISANAKIHPIRKLPFFGDYVNGDFSLKAKYGIVSIYQ